MSTTNQPASTPPIPIYSHPSPATTILPVLHSQLPLSLPLCQRIVFALRHNNEAPYSSPTARILATFPPSSSSPPTSASPPYTIAHVDLARHPETQIWIFSSLETLLARTDPFGTTTDHVTDHAATRQAQQQLLALLSYIHTALVPLQPATDPIPPSEQIKTMKKLPYSKSRVLIGTLHTALRDLLPRDATERVDPGYLKYIFPRECYERGGRDASGGDAPLGFRYGDMQRGEDLRLVLDRTHIPRRVGTLKKLEGVGLFPEEGGDGDGRPAPIGWGFMGFDGSLSSLHVEREYRGKSLGVEITRKLFRGVSGEVKKEDGSIDDGGWRHADVGEENMGSRRVMEKIGGTAMWRVCWVEVELERIFGPVGEGGNA